MIRLLSKLTILIALPAQADVVTTDAGSSLFTGDYLLQVVGSFFLVICVLLAVMLLLKRFNTVGISKTGYIQILASAPLGQRERAVLLQVGEEQILVGVAAGSVSSIPEPASSTHLRARLWVQSQTQFASCLLLCFAHTSHAHR